MESFSSASYSKWDDEHAWSSQEWKTDTEMYDPIRKQSAMSKRGQEATSSEGAPMAKPKPMDSAMAKSRSMNLTDNAQPVECEEEPSARFEQSQLLRNPSRDPIENS